MMTSWVMATVCVLALVLLAAWAGPESEDAARAVPASGHSGDPNSPASSEPRYKGFTLHRAVKALEKANRERLKLRASMVKARRQWRPTVDYAYRLASAVTGVSYWQLRAVAWCESRHSPWATNGSYGGLFQLGWAPFGMSKFDPVANALSAALTVKRDGSWRQWACKP